MRAEELKRIRKSTGMTQKEFAKVLNTPLGTYKNWEQGRHRIPGLTTCIVRSHYMKEK